MNSKFDKFTKNRIVELSTILGGTATGAGGRCNGEVPGGESYSRWSSDDCDADGSCSYKNYSSSVIAC